MLQRDTASTQAVAGRLGGPDSEVSAAWANYQKLRAAHAVTVLGAGQRIAPEVGFRNPANYRLRMILAAGRLTHPNLP